MRDLGFVFYLLALVGLGFRRPFLFVLAYAYVDIVSPQHLSYYLLSGAQISSIVAALAIGGWLIADDKSGFSVSGRQVLMAILLVYCGFTTYTADFPVDALTKWDWAWKAMFWAIFLPFTLRTRLRIEAYLLFMTLSAAAIIIVGGIKTLASGGGYGALNLMVTSNTGLYEGSTISTVAIALVPVILWLARFGTIYPRDWRVRAVAYNLVFACLLIPVGTEARTGLVCIAALVILMLRDVKRRLVYMGLIGLAAAAAIPMLPDSFSSRMETISNYESDSSATSRIAVWAWTWEYAQSNPLGGGFDAYRQNSLQVKTVATKDSGPVQQVSEAVMIDKGRAYHSSYFEMLGEQGYPGLALFLLIHIGGLVTMERLRRRYRKAEGEDAWISPLATALQHFQIIYLIGGLFVGIAFQPFMLMIVSVQIGFGTLVRRREKAEPPARPAFAPAPRPAAEPA